MPTKTEAILCKFIGDFKVGDNLVFNAELLCKLTASNDDGTFNKLIAIQAGAIVEAALAQILYRAQKHTREGVPNISEADRSAIEGKKKIDRFKAIIDVMKKYKVLDSVGAGIYDELDKLRAYRNKVHIQLDIAINGVSRDESTAFSDEIRDWALGLNVRILQHLSERFPRPKGLEQHAQLLSVPSP
jgi:hypothetical protein